MIRVNDFFESDCYWLTIPFLDERQRKTWLTKQVDVVDFLDAGYQITLHSTFKIVYILEKSEAIQKETLDAHLVFDFAYPSGLIFKHSTSFYTISYPRKGRLRWMYPTANTQPTFLHLYYQQTARAKVLSMLLKAGFLFKKWFGKPSLTVYSNLPLPPDELGYKEKATNYAISMGVPGPGRSLVTAYARGKKSIMFAKYATSKSSLENLNKEKIALSAVSMETAFAVPKILVNEEALLVTTSVFPQKGNFAKDLNNELIQYWTAYYGDKIETRRLVDIFPYQEIMKDINAWTQHSDLEMAQLAREYKQLLQLIDINMEVPVCSSHGDFTPWNVFQDKKGLYVFDWELFATARPLFFDFIHFIVQKNIFTGSGRFIDIHNELKKLKNHPAIITHLVEFNITIEQAFLYYLLIRPHFYLANYVTLKHHSDRERLHLQFFLKAFSYAIWYHNQSCRREDFLVELERMLNKKYSYALLKFFQESLIEVSSYADIDMAIGRNSIPSLISFVKEQPFVERVQKEVLTFKTIIKVHFIDGTFVVLDCIHRFQRKNKIYLPIDELLESRVMRGSVYVPAIYFDFSYYVLFQIQNGGSLKPEVLNKYNRRAEAYDEAESLKNVFRFWDIKDGIASLATKRKVIHYIGSINNVYNYFRLSFNYLWDTLSQFTLSPYPIVTFSGPDGSGKSTYLEHAIYLLEKQFRLRLIRKRHRPGLLPILSAVKHGGRAQAEASAAARLPRQGRNSGVLSSFIRFTYYYVDYLAGQLWILLRYRLWGVVVVYDRYYFDFINDSRRSNIDLPKSLLRFGYTLVHKPDVNIFLHSTAEEILKRKQELQYDEIELLNEDYIKLFGQFGRRYGADHYVIMRNKTIEGTKRKIQELFKTKFAELS